MTLNRKTAARALGRIAALLEIRGDNVHRVRAFSNAARVVERVEDDLEGMIESGEILNLKGIGKGTAGVLSDLADDRTPEILAELETEIPTGVREMLKIKGLGPKKVRAVWRDLGFQNLGELEYACRENRLVELPGFGAKTQTRLIEAIQFHRQSAERRLLSEAHAIAESAVSAISGRPAIDRVLLAGELRRWCETIGGLDLVVETSDENEAGRSIAAGLEEAQRAEDGRWSARADGGFGLSISLVRPAESGAVRLWATGSEAHLEALSERAAARGLEIGRNGLWKGGIRLEVETEEQIYEALGCVWIPPELRELAGDVVRAAHGELPRIVEAGDLRGVLHNHTTDSDGAATVSDMALAAAARGWSFFGVADHSPAATYANGVDAERLRDQWRRIDEFNEGAAGTRIVKGLEADILADGSLDIPDGCDAGLEYLVASVHSGFQMTEDAQTERIIRAVRHPACSVLGHPTGRLLLARPGFDVDLDRVLEACADAGVAVEINASPYRLDLDWIWARRALELGLKLAINPDAHTVDGLDDVTWGLAVARRAGATAADLVNCGDIEEFIGGR